MRRFYYTLLYVCILFISAGASATVREDSLNKYDRLDTADLIQASFKYQYGEIPLSNGAVLSVPAGYRFLDAAQGRVLVETLWGNASNPDCLGVLLPVQSGREVSGIVISNDTTGYLSEQEALHINYTLLMHRMNQQLYQENIWRRLHGYSVATEMKWAFLPYYNRQDNTLHLARLLHFSDAPREVVNYEMRILSRKGALCFNAIAPPAQLNHIREVLPMLAKQVHFTAGNAYLDFNPRTDQLAWWTSEILMAGHFSIHNFINYVINTWLFIVVFFILVLFVYIMQFFHRRKDDHHHVFRIDESLN
ncbi:DUF2167 domain-containing protein [Chitinophaga sp. Mgbs1]|uniref:DUF2167 domain-containing protein n=1 Tax=Chitinophaga solisilvae TaxID=1233460 RepID=A0A3S1BNX6_9BACT|nr:DUF2167 domain-containing protein [Chitinophaga solisilvae]